MQGSKYDADLRTKVVARCMDIDMTPAKVAKEFGIPRSTVYDWYQTDKNSDPDLIAIKRNKLRKLMDKAYSVAGRSIDGLEKQSKVLKLEKNEIDKILLKILTDGELDDEIREKMAEIVKKYTGTSMIDMLKIAKESFEISEKLESHLSGGEDSSVIQISFADGDIEEMMG